MYAGALFWPQERAAEYPLRLADVGGRHARFRHLGRPPPQRPGRSWRCPLGCGVARSCSSRPPASRRRTRASNCCARYGIRSRRSTPSRCCRQPVSATLHMDPVGPVPAFIDGWLLSDLPPAAIDALVQSCRPRLGIARCSRSSCDTWGRAWPTAAPDHGALASLDAGFATATYSLVPDADRGRRRGASRRHAADGDGAVGGGAQLPQLRRAILRPGRPLLARRSANGLAVSRRSTTLVTSSGRHIRSRWRDDRRRGSRRRRTGRTDAPG